MRYIHTQPCGWGLFSLHIAPDQALGKTSILKQYGDFLKHGRNVLWKYNVNFLWLKMRLKNSIKSDCVGIIKMMENRKRHLNIFLKYSPCWLTSMVRFISCFEAKLCDTKVKLASSNVFKLEWHILKTLASNGGDTFSKPWNSARAPSAGGAPLWYESKN